jgi:abequosyltransferase
MTLLPQDNRSGYLLTIAIPTYNRSKYLDCCLKHIHKQWLHYKELVEIIVSNNNSEDDTDAIVANYQQQGLDIVYEKNNENIGADGNFAKCFSLASGKYVLIFGDDDILLDGALDFIIPLIKEKNFGVVSLNAYGFVDDYKITPENTSNDVTVYSSYGNFLKAINISITFASGNIVNKSIVSETINPLEFMGTSLVHLNWVLSAIFTAPENAVIGRYLVAFKTANTGGYRLATVFGVNLNKIFDEFIARGIPRNCFDAINQELVKSFFPGLILLERSSRASGFSFEKENYYETLHGVFRNYPYFWLLTFPAIKFPYQLAKRWNIAFNLISGTSKYLKQGNLSTIMDKLLIKMICGVAKIVALLVPGRFFYYAKLFSGKVRWNIIKKGFGAIGEGSIIENPWMISNPRNMFIGRNFSALTMLRIETIEEYFGEKYHPRLVIGDNVSFNNDCHIGCINKIEIGNNVLGASRIYITDHYHGAIMPEDINTVPVHRKLTSKGPVIIGDNVWIGEGVTILPGVTIGNNAIIGANSLVNKDIPQDAVAAGVPAKVIKILSAIDSR